MACDIIIACYIEEFMEASLSDYLIHEEISSCCIHCKFVAEREIFALCSKERSTDEILWGSKLCIRVVHCNDTWIKTGCEIAHNIKLSNVLLILLANLLLKGEWKDSPL